MDDTPLLDAAGRRRSPATTPGFHCGRPPRNKGLRYPADPPSVAEVVTVMRIAGEAPYGLRTRALAVLLWRAGLRISEALALAESDLDRGRGAVLVRRGRGAKRREVGMDHWAWEIDHGCASASSCASAPRCAYRRNDARMPMVGCRRARHAAAARRPCRRPTPLRTPPAPTRSRSRDGP